ncbi:hypothetical protein FWG95_02855 [Candidatus Saccharibacteria bacterium]|nr:hypothetical protein [Candidatus Saccharibacteria bacterium]
MVEWIRLARKRGLWADVLHAVFNLLFATLVVATVMFFPDTPWPALLLVLLSKWRVLAVRPRYWWNNILSSLPDLVMGLGMVVLMWQAGVLGSAVAMMAWPMQIVLGAFYAFWLIWLKPQHKHKLILVQSGVSQFVGLMAIFGVAYLLPLWAVVGLAFIVSFAAARQILGLHEEKDQTLLALIWGLAVSQLAFAAWHWTVAYQITPLLRVPQMAIVIAVLSFVAERAYAGWHNDHKIQWHEVQVSVIFAIAVIGLLVVGFGGLF